jgi:hypothetical protein
MPGHANSRVSTIEYFRSGGDIEKPKTLQRKHTTTTEDETTLMPTILLPGRSRIDLLLFSALTEVRLIIAPKCGVILGFRRLRMNGHDRGR